jgi:tetratricopeptide (TPR) repeat protein
MTLTRLYRIDALRRAGRVDEALAEAPEALQQVLRVFGPRNSVTALAYAVLGNAQNEKKRTADAVDSFRHAYDASRAAVGDDHPNTLRMAFNLAQLLVEAGRSDQEVEVLYRDVLVRGDKQPEALRSTLVFWRISFARFLITHDRATDALAQLVSPESAAQLELAADLANDYSRVLDEAMQAAGCKQAQGTSGCAAAQQMQLSIERAKAEAAGTKS